jgi:aminobenzoyl-glutamate utilization protein B
LAAALPLKWLLKKTKAVGAPRFDEKKRAFARELQKSLPSPSEEVLNEEVRLLGDMVGLYSQDEADLSWLCPLGLTRTSTWVVGTPAHTWQATGGVSIGQKGMMKAAQVMALAAIDLDTKPEALERVWKGFKERTRVFTYRCLVPGDVNPMEQ